MKQKAGGLTKVHINAELMKTCTRGKETTK